MRLKKILLPVFIGMLILSASLVAVVMGTADKTQRKENYALETVEPNANAGELPIDETLSIGDTISTDDDGIYDTQTPGATKTYYSNGSSSIYIESGETNVTLCFNDMPYTNMGSTDALQSGISSGTVTAMGSTLTITGVQTTDLTSGWFDASYMGYAAYTSIAVYSDGGDWLNTFWIYVNYKSPTFKLSQPAIYIDSQVANGTSWTIDVTNI